MGESLTIIENGKPGGYMSTKYGPTSIAATSNGLVAVGGDVSYRYNLWHGAVN